ncbi:hypothetical protein [Sphingomonas sp. BK580]|uniref:hypothetical protein n=1 Tax=Sphingomonas sp. BK580 TaxID=2586972 RepID=UPI0016144B95|nr:hypothetical protein [Sphingomonas sp. BK580]MBB3693575.1 hypothetical protein [Sphingomonas sp. BK580]
MLVWLILQVAISGPTIETRLGRVRPCESVAAGSEVVVCGRALGQEAFRLRAPPERYEANSPAVPKAETFILRGHAKLPAETEQAGVRGFVSNRGLVRLKSPFGRKWIDGLG